MSLPDDPSARARSRGGWPVQRVPLGQEPADGHIMRTTPEERVLMMWPLTRDAWAMAGKPFPTYRREEIPVRRIHPGTRSTDRPDE
jgi:hypothetical protein